MYFDKFSEEKLIAFNALLREFDLNNRRQDIADLFAVSVGRAYWKYWNEADLRDSEWVEDGEGRFHQTDGWPEKGGEPADVWRRKWTRRATLFSSWNHEQINHVLDWLIAAANEPAAWIANLDPQGQPKKLMKCRSLERLTHEADKAMRRQNASLSERAAQLGIDDEHFVHDLGAGHALVRLLSERALDMESARMHHCIGHGAYDSQLYSGRSQLLSVRDQDGKPVATLQVFHFEGRDYLARFYGPFNKKPEDHLHDLIAPREYGTIDEYQEASAASLRENQNLLWTLFADQGVPLC